MVDESIPSLDRSWPMRLWLAAPDWLFRLAGAAFFFGLVAIHTQKYRHGNFWELGPFYKYADGRVVHMPWVPVLVDLTFLLIAMSFCFRLPTRTRAANGWVIAYTLFTGFSPFLPLWLSPLLGWFSPEQQQIYEAFMWREVISWQQTFAYVTLMTAGIGLEVWGYAVLFRSLSIVPEPRVLKITGPYRFVRHPIYFGQFVAQAAVWLIACQTHFVWIGLYCVFVPMQLYRSKLEDRVLEKAFGEPYRQWQRQTFWFV